MKTPASDMKIIQIAKYYYPHHGGIEKQVQLLAEGLNTEVIASGDSKETNINGVKVHFQKELFSLSSAPITPSLIKKLNNIKTDIIHLHLPNPFAVLALLYANPKTKIVISWHADVSKEKRLFQFYKPFLKRLLRKSDAIIGATESHINTKILKEFKNKCKIIPYGIDIPIHNNNQINNKNNNITNNKILFIGRLVNYKGIEYLIKAMEKIDNELIIIGNGILKDKLINLTKRLNLSKKILFVGETDENTKNKYLQECSMLVLPSITEQEAFGIVQLEAMVYSKPIISTRLGTGVELVNLNQKTGIVIPPKDPEALSKAINFLIENPKIAQEYGENGRKRVEEFRSDLMIKRYHDLYQDITWKIENLKNTS